MENREEKLSLEEAVNVLNFLMKNSKVTADNAIKNLMKNLNQFSLDKNQEEKHYDT